MRRLPVVILCALVSPAVAGLDQTISDLAAIAKYDAREAVRLQILSNSTGGARLVKHVALNLAGFGRWPWQKPYPSPPAVPYFIKLVVEEPLTLVSCFVGALLLLWACAQLLKPSKPRLDPVLSVVYRLINKKGDGQATRAEFDAALAPVEAAATAALLSMLGLQGQPPTGLLGFAGEQLKQKAIAEVFGKMDADSKGSVTMDEFQRWALDQRFVYDPLLTLLFMMIHRGAGDEMTLEELSKALKPIEDEVDKAVAQLMGVGSLPLPEKVKGLARDMLFRKMDANASNGVDLDEWQRFLQDKPKLA